MKKKLAFLLTATLCIMMFISCKKQISSKLQPDNPVIITVWYYYNGLQKQAFDDLIDEFNFTKGKELGIIVEGYNYGGVSELADSIRASANNNVGAEKLPNIFAGYSDIAKEIDDMGMVADLDLYMTTKEKEKYVSEYIKEGDLDGKGSFKIFPIAKSTEVLVLNKTVWNSFSEEENVSQEELKTWEGIAKVAEKYYNWSGGKAFFGRDAFANYMFVGSKQLGQEILVKDEDGTKVVIDEKVMRRLWDNYYVPYIKGYYTHEGKFASDDAKTGVIAAFVASTSGAGHFPTEVYLDNGDIYPIECDILELPNFEGCEPYAVQQGAGMIVTKTDEIHEYASTVFLKWFSEAERNLNFSTVVGYLPVMKEVNNIEAINKVMDQSNGQIDENVKNALIKSVEQCRKYNLFTNPVVENSSKYRNIINLSMNDKASKDRQIIENMIEKEIKIKNVDLDDFDAIDKIGESCYKEYYEKNKDSIFKEWFEGLKQELSEVSK